jgi:hypothetical protein
MSMNHNLFSNLKQEFKETISLFGVHSRQASLFFFSTVIAVLMAMTIFCMQYALKGANTILIQGLCLIFALLWTFVTGRGIFSQVSKSQLSSIRIHPAWLLVLVAILLRIAAYTFMPPPNQTGFEEIEQGSIAYSILRNLFLQVEFRFTNILATLGMASGLGYSLETIRLPFKILGIIGLIFVVLILRKLKVSWFPIIVLTIITATLRMFVIFSGAAFELFSGIPMATIFLFLVIQAEDSSTLHRGFWYGLAGVMAGILMFEFVAYRILPILFLGWIAYKAIEKHNSESTETRSQRWFYLILYIIPLYLVALPTFAQTISNPAGSTFLEAYTRHRGERPQIISPNASFLLQNLISGSFGFPSAESAYYSIPQDPAILPVVGWLFGISLIYNLFFPVSNFSRPLVISVIITILLGGLFANDYHIGRMGPNFPVMTVLSALMLNVFYAKLQKWIHWLATRRQIFTVILPENQPLLLERPKNEDGTPTDAAQSDTSDTSQRVIIDVSKAIFSSIRTVSYLLIISITLGITVSNFQSIIRMSQDIGSLNEYTNDDYSVCSFIGSVAQPDQRVVIVSIDHGGFCSDNLDATWYFNGKNLTIVHAEDSISAINSLVPGDILAFATRNRQFAREETDQFVKIATDLNSLSTIQFGKNMLGKTTVGTICYQCGNTE